MLKTVLEVNDVNFDAEVKRSTLPVLVDFWAPWCGPCRRQIPVVEQLAAELSGKAKIVKLNVDDNQQKAGEYGISGIPALLIFNNGEMVDRLTGFHDINQLKAKLQKYIQ